MLLVIMLHCATARYLRIPGLASKLKPLERAANPETNNVVLVVVLTSRLLKTEHQLW
jgi:hypothetical protein